ncbi:hypothetical protein BDV19DRAFT_369537 [Aspergillus venezuelensis]
MYLVNNMYLENNKNVGSSNKRVSRREYAALGRWVGCHWMRVMVSPDSTSYSIFFLFLSFAPSLKDTLPLLVPLAFSQPSSSRLHTSHLLPPTPTQRRFLACIQLCREEPTQKPHPWVHYPLPPQFCHIRSTGLCSSQFAASYLYTAYFFTSSRPGASRP